MIPLAGCVVSTRSSHTLENKLYKLSPGSLGTLLPPPPPLHAASHFQLCIMRQVCHSFWPQTVWPHPHPWWCPTAGPIPEPDWLLPLLHPMPAHTSPRVQWLLHQAGDVNFSSTFISRHIETRTARRKTILQPECPILGSQQFKPSKIPRKTRGRTHKRLLSLTAINTECGKRFWHIKILPLLKPMEESRGFQWKKIKLQPAEWKSRKAGGNGCSCAR